MKNQGNKLHNKAMYYYSNGELEKALNICEKGMSLGLSNASLINLKGLLLYIQGDYQGAKATWRICKDFNNDDIAKKYLHGLELDSDKEGMYRKALSLYNDVKIVEALEILDDCATSDFNFINVNVLRSKAYIKLGEWEKAQFYLMKLKEKDKNNKYIKEIEQEIALFTGEKKHLPIKLISVLGSIGLLVAIVIFLRTPIQNLFTKKEPPKNNVVIEAKEDTTAKENNQTKEEVVTKDWSLLQPYIDKKDYDSMLDFIHDVKIDSLDANQRKLYLESKDLLDKDGIKYFYDKANGFFKNKDFVNAISEYKKAYEVSEGNYLREHISYLIATSYESNQQVDKAIEAYKDYLKENEKGEYAAEVNYRLAILNKNINKDESVKYANVIKSTYKNSMYYNSKIKGILGE
ncbi:tetratricopeptide repeat protein [Clostridium sp. YIM B02551]|uniref:tetratricopeptide repeat protein n=1 Tax=Clostridium sp. YIM B02551 TaxID=2910679 RepID=UPI001EEAB987|nr:tetratricopeptide repeat protein [Clostridium sp. YIM B02551]